MEFGGGDEEGRISEGVWGSYGEEIAWGAVSCDEELIGPKEVVKGDAHVEVFICGEFGMGMSEE